MSLALVLAGGNIKNVVLEGNLIGEKGSGKLLLAWENTEVVINFEY